MFVPEMLHPVLVAQLLLGVADSQRGPTYAHAAYEEPERDGLDRDVSEDSVHDHGALSWSGTENRGAFCSSGFHRAGRELLRGLGVGLRRVALRAFRGRGELALPDAHAALLFRGRG